MTDTTPMPVAAVPRRPALIGRFTITLADLLAAGTLLLGLVLLVAMIVLPADGAGAYENTTGPGWGRAAAHLGVGIIGELAGQLARRRPRPVRIGVAVLTVVAVLVVLAASWWR